MKLIKDIFFNEENKKRNLICYGITLFVSVLAYNLMLIYGYTNPDGIMEGLTYYNNAVVASTMSGRWFVRYLEMGFANIVNPTLSVFYNSFCIATLSLSPSRSRCGEWREGWAGERQ